MYECVADYKILQSTRGYLWASASIDQFDAISLLVATGLRPGEALRLERSDVDVVSGILSIRESKFGNYAASLAMPIALG